MKKHTRIYMDAFGYDKGDFVACEITGQRAVDIQHITPRGMGGSKQRDRIENLMALTREMHEKCEHGQISKTEQYKIHQEFLDISGVTYDPQFFKDLGI